MSRNREQQDTTVAAPRSELDYRKTGNQSKVADVECCDRITRVQSGCTNQQVFECDAYTASSLLALDLTRELGDFEGHWMNDQVSAQFLSKFPSTLAISIALGAVDAMSKFNDGYGRKSRFSFALRCLNALEDFPHTFTASFSCNENAGVENQSHAERSRALRVLMISLRSAAKAGSILGS